MRNNVVEAVPSNPIRNKRCGSVKYFDNRTSAGALVQGFEENQSKKYDELETNVEDAFVLGYMERR